MTGFLQTRLRTTAHSIHHPENFRLGVRASVSMVSSQQNARPPPGFLKKEGKRLPPPPCLMSVLSLEKVCVHPPDQAASNPSLQRSHKPALGMVGDSRHHWCSEPSSLHQPPARSGASGVWDAVSCCFKLGLAVRDVTFYEHLGRRSTET